jgi:hypothetical protein
MTDSQIGKLRAWLTGHSIAPGWLLRRRRNEPAAHLSSSTAVSPEHTW